MYAAKLGNSNSAFLAASKYFCWCIKTMAFHKGKISFEIM